MSNNPVSFIDPDGGWDGDGGVAVYVDGVRQSFVSEYSKEWFINDAFRRASILEIDGILPWELNNFVKKRCRY